MLMAFALPTVLLIDTSAKASVAAFSASPPWHRSAAFLVTKAAKLIRNVIEGVFLFVSWGCLAAEFYDFGSFLTTTNMLPRRGFGWGLVCLIGLSYSCRRSRRREQKK